MFDANLFAWSAAFVALAIGIMLLIQWIRRNNIVVKWYDWLIGAIGLALLVFTMQNFVTSFWEDVPQAAWMFLLVTGLPALILLAVAWQLVARRQRAGS